MSRSGAVFLICIVAHVLATLAVVCASIGAAPIEVAAKSLSTYETYEVKDEDRVRRYALADPVPAGKPITVITRLRLGTPGPGGEPAAPELFRVSSGLNAVQEIWLAGLSAKAGEAPTLIALGWAPDRSGWAPSWRFQLRSDAGILLSESERVVLPASANPEWGAAYDTILSYDPVEGMLTFRVTETESGRTLHAGTVSVRAFSGELFPGAGFQSRADEAVPAIDVLALEGIPRFVPADARAHVIAKESEGAPFGPTRHVDRRDELAVELTVPPRAVDGPLRLVLNDGEARSLLAEVKGASGTQVIPVDGSAFPAGTVDLVLEYQAADRRFQLDRQSLEVGQVALDTHGVELTTTAGGKRELTGTLRVAADGPLPLSALRLAYEVGVPGVSAPLHQDWETKVGEISLPLAGLGEGGDPGGAEVEVPFRIPLGGLAQDADGEVFVTLSATTGLDGHLHREHVKRLIFGDRRPAFPKVGPYHVLRGDFHVHTTASHDGRVSPDERVWGSYRQGYDVIALTDHGSTLAYDESVDVARALGLVLIRGMETGMEPRSGGEHFIVFGLDETYVPRDEHVWALTPESHRVYFREQARRVAEHGGIIVYAHPGWPNPELESEPVQWLLDQGILRGVEVLWDQPADRRDWAFQWALDHGLAVVESSDIHGSRTFERAVSAPVTLVLAEEATPEGVVEAFRAGRTLAWQAGQLRGAEEWLVRLIDATLDMRVIQSGGSGKERCLRIRQEGALRLHGVAEVDGGGGRHRIFLDPGESTCVPLGAQSQSVRIRWANVWSGPQTLLQTSHDVK